MGSTVSVSCAAPIAAQTHPASARESPDTQAHACHSGFIQAPGSFHGILFAFRARGQSYT